MPLTRDLEAIPAAVSAGDAELRSVFDDGPTSPLHEGSCCSPGDLGSSLMRTTDTEGDAVRDEEEDDVEEGPAPTGVMVMALFLPDKSDASPTAPRRTLAEGNGEAAGQHGSESVRKRLAKRR